MSTVEFQQARIIDGRGRTIEGATVTIRDGRIAALERGRPRRPVEKTSRLDARGWTIIPGLIDCHVHLGLGAEADVVRATLDAPTGLSLLKAARAARVTLESGFTTVRDVGHPDHSIFALKRAIAEGLVPGPRILAAGQAICMTGGHARFIGRQADGPDDVVLAVREQLAAGADVIKFIASGGVLTAGTSPECAQLSPDELAAGVAEARRAGRRVAAHAHGTAGMKNAILAGANSIEHATLMDGETATLMRRHAVYMVPTLSALATTADCGLACGIPESAVTKAQSMRSRHEESFRQAHRLGLRIAMGTDAGTPLNLHGENAQELERMVSLGMTPMEAILASTSSAACLLGIDHEVGTLQVGKIADLVVLDGNPLKQIDVLRDRSKILGVMQAGRFVSGPLMTP